MQFSILTLALFGTFSLFSSSLQAQSPWPRHTIDNSSSGADGVKLQDINYDGRMDIVTGWEEGGITQIYLHPGRDYVKTPWPATTVGNTPNVEDAVFADLNNDGRWEVISATEGKTQQIFIHWPPVPNDSTLWQQTSLPAADKLTQWMYVEPLQVDGRHGIDLIAGSKGKAGQIGWFEAPADTKDMDAWKWHKISDAGWIMSIILKDMDQDGDQDVLITDRKGPLRGCRWLENPGEYEAQKGEWKNHFVGGQEVEVMFISMADLDGDGGEEILVPERTEQTIRIFSPENAPAFSWDERILPLPSTLGKAKSVEVGYLNGDPIPDLVISTNTLGENLSGLGWLDGRKLKDNPQPEDFLSISGIHNAKYDKVELLDVDEDGDLDILICEENFGTKSEGLGVIWYENPMNIQTVTHNQVSHIGPWQQAQRIREHILTPTFPDSTFNVLDFGAQPDKEGPSHPAINQAIQVCHEAGGGIVQVPEGAYSLSGPIILKSHVNLHLEAGAKLLFSTDPIDYLPVVFSRWEGSELMNYSPFIYARGQENIAITGKGIIDGQASTENWWRWNGKEQYGWEAGMPTQKADQELLRSMTHGGIPVAQRVFGEGHYLRPNLIQLIACHNVWIESVTIQNAPMWLLNPVLCVNVRIENVSFNGLGPNSDGIDPESCHAVLIQDCHFNTGDDCIAIKSGRDRDGRKIGVPSDYIFIRNCELRSQRSVMAIGSEMSGGVSHVYMENCTVISEGSSRRLLRIKSSSQRGGSISHFYMRNIDASQAQFTEGGIFLDMQYGNQTGTHIPRYSHFTIENVKMGSVGGYSIKTRLLEQSPLENLTLRNIYIEQAETRPLFSHVNNLKLDRVFVNGQEVKTE